MDPHGSGAYWISLAFTFLGAGIFSVVRARRGRIPQEAFIGITYAVASAAAILAMSKATGETEHLQHMLVGNILAVSWSEAGRTALLYGAIGLFHYIFRKNFLLISIDPQAVEAKGLSIRLWDFLFYASFGFVVTSSVAIAGGNVVCGTDWASAGDWLDDGHTRFGARSLPLGGVGPTDRRDHCLYFWLGSAGDVLGSFGALSRGQYS
jgi:hypothetical protein